jgi:hypothetical protein
MGECQPCIVPGEAVGSEVVDEIETRVQGRLGGQLRDFRVQPQGAGLILQGHARTYYAKQLAQHAVMEACGLPILANEIEVG